LQLSLLQTASLFLFFFGVDLGLDCVSIIVVFSRFAPAFLLFFFLLGFLIFGVLLDSRRFCGRRIFIVLVV
jgi:uncharacterized membrane protein YdcZ (DUF606 family)